MEKDANVKTPVFRNVFNSLSAFAKTLTKNDDINNEIEDIDNLSSFSNDERATIEEIRKVEAQLKKKAANMNSKRNFQKQIESKNLSIEPRNLLRTDVEKEEKIRS